MFKDKWLYLSKYSSWLKKASKCTEFRCHLCETTCKLSDLGSAALDSHARGQKHQAWVQSKEKSKLFFVKPQASSKPSRKFPKCLKTRNLRVHLHHQHTSTNHGGYMQKSSGLCTAQITISVIIQTTRFPRHWRQCSQNHKSYKSRKTRLNTFGTSAWRPTSKVYSRNR